MKIMGIHDFDKHFRGLGFDPVILNDVPARTREEREKLHSLIVTTYNFTDTLESIPSCECGALSYGYNLGALCSNCGTRVEFATDRDIESTVWLRAPDNIRSLISPQLWMMLTDVMKKSGFNVLHWFCDARRHDPPATNKSATAICKRFIKSGIPRGFNSFIDNFEQLIPIISDIPPVPQRKPLLEFLCTFKDLFFPQHLPIPSKVAFVMENTSVGTFVDTTISNAIDACLTITSLDQETRGNQRKLEERMASIVNDLACYYDHTFGDSFSSKEGWLRKTVFGSRLAWSFRSVIISESGVHDYETIKLPYSQCCTVFRVHILNKLHKRGFSHRAAWDYVFKHTNNRDPLMEEILTELFREAPGGQGIWCLFIRYPTLARASIQALRVIGFLDNCATLSVMGTVGANADKVRRYLLSLLRAVLSIRKGRVVLL